MLAITAVIGFVVSWAVATFVTDEVLVVSDVFAYSVVFSALISSVMGILVFTSEAHHGTLATTLAANQARSVVAASKTVIATALGMFLGAVGLATGFCGAVAGAIDMGDASSTLATSAWALLFTGLAATLGLGIGMVVPNSAGAISGLLAWWLVFETLLIEVLPESSARFLPYVAGFRMLGVGSEFDSAQALDAALTSQQNAVVFAGYAVVALAVGTAVLYRRDPS